MERKWRLNILFQFCDSVFYIHKIAAAKLGFLRTPFELLKSCQVGNQAREWRYNHQPWVIGEIVWNKYMNIEKCILEQKLVETLSLLHLVQQEFLPVSDILKENLW